MKEKLAKVTSLGTPKPFGEMVILTDASDSQGGATIFQWQLVPNEVLKNVRKDFVPDVSSFETKGVKPDGSFDHNYPSSFALVPLGHYSWKWNDTRKRYNTYERELLSGVLAISTQFRMLAHQKIVWFCDNQATRSFIDSAPPTNPRLRRWYTFLAQMSLTIKHISGLKNELCDWLSRGQFESLVQEDFDSIAGQAFERMDQQLDFGILFKISDVLKFSKEDYLESEYKDIWNSLEERRVSFCLTSLRARKRSSSLMCLRFLAIS